MKKKDIISLILFLCIALPFAAILTGCSAKDPFKNGVIVEQNIRIDKEYTIGDTSKTGWQLDISDHTFDEDVVLTMKVLSIEEAKEYEQNDFALWGTPVELKLEGKESVRLGQPAIITLQIPEEHLEDIAAEELFFAYYYDGEWEYFSPDSIDTDKGTATFTIYHFSFLGFGKPSEEEQIKTYTKAVAVSQWKKESEKQKYFAATSKDFDNLFTELGVKSSSARNQMIADVVSCLDSESKMGYFDFMAQSYNSSIKGENATLEFENKSKEFLGKALYQVLDKKPSSFADKVNIFGNLASAAGSIAGGDSKAAMESIANMLNGAVPVSQLAASTTAFIAAQAEDAIDYWTAGEIEKAYQTYAGNSSSKYGFALEKDFDNIFITLGGGQRMMDSKVIKQYCDRRGKDPNALSEMEKTEIVDKARIALKRSFDERIIAEPEIEKLKQEEESFIAELKKQGLLSASNNRKYFGIDKNLQNFDVTTRLHRLYNIKNSILSMMDKNDAKTIEDEFLVKAIARWIECSEKNNMASFYEFMNTMNYIKNTAYESGGAWVLVNTVDFDGGDIPKSEVYENQRSYSRGSYSYTVTYTGPTDTYYDPPTLNGETFSSQAIWSTPPERLEAGEPVSLTLSFNVIVDTQSYFDMAASASAYFDKADMEPGFATAAAIDFVDENGHYSFSVNRKTPSVNVNVTAVAPSGGEGQQIALLTAFYPGIRMGTAYVYKWE